MKSDEILSIKSEEVDNKDVVKDFSKNVDNPDDADELIIELRIERILKRKKNNILKLAYHQGIIFKKYKNKKCIC